MQQFFFLKSKHYWIKYEHFKSSQSISQRIIGLHRVRTDPSPSACIPLLSYKLNGIHADNELLHGSVTRKGVHSDAIIPRSRGCSNGQHPHPSQDIQV
jgi:hypothetical protein